MKEDEAAVIIQKCFREYLLKKNTKTKVLKNYTLKNENGTRAREVLDQVNIFYKKLCLLLRKKEDIKRLCAKIDEMSTEIRSIKTLEDCSNLETSFNSDQITLVEKTHQEQFAKNNPNWWEKLDFCDQQI